MYIYLDIYIHYNLFCIENKVIESVDYDGQNRRTMYRTQRAPRFISISPDVAYTTVFWTEYTTR